MMIMMMMMMDITFCKSHEVSKIIDHGRDETFEKAKALAQRKKKRLYNRVANM